MEIRSQVTFKSKYEIDVCVLMIIHIVILELADFDTQPLSKMHSKTEISLLSKT